MKSDDSKTGIGIGASAIIGFIGAGIGAAFIAPPIIATTIALVGLTGGAILGGQLLAGKKGNSKNTGNIIAKTNNTEIH